MPRSKHHTENVNDATLVAWMENTYGEASLKELFDRATMAQPILEDWMVEIDTVLSVINIPPEKWTVRKLHEKLLEQDLLNYESKDLDRFASKLGLKRDDAEALNTLPEGLERALFVRDSGVLATSRKNTEEYQEFKQDVKVFREYADQYIKKLKLYSHALKQQIDIHSEHGESFIQDGHIHNDDLFKGIDPEIADDKYFQFNDRTMGDYERQPMQVDKLPLFSHALDAYIRDVESYRNGEMELPKMAIDRDEYPTLPDYSGDVLTFPLHAMEGGRYQKDKIGKLTHWELKQAAWKDDQLMPSLPIDPRTMRRNDEGEILPQTTHVVTSGQKTLEGMERSYEKRQLLELNRGKHLSTYAVSDAARVILVIENPENEEHVKALVREKIEKLSKYNNLHKKPEDTLFIDYRQDFKAGGMRNSAIKIPINGVINEIKIMERGQLEAYLFTHKIFEIQRRMEVDGKLIFKETSVDDPELLKKAYVVLGKKDVEEITAGKKELTDGNKEILAGNVNAVYETDRQLMQAEYRNILYKVDKYHKAAQAVLATNKEFKQFEWQDVDGYGKENSFSKDNYAVRYDELKSIHQAIHVSYMLSPDQLHKVFGEGVMERDSETGKLPVHEASLAWRLDYAASMQDVNDKAERKHLLRQNKELFKPPFPENYIDFVLSEKERVLLDDMRISKFADKYTGESEPKRANRR